MNKMDYSEFLESCMEQGYTGTADQLREAYNEYLNTPEKKENSYNNILEFFVENGVSLNKDQIAALQEKSSAWNRYVDSRAKEAEKHGEKEDVYRSVGAEKAADKEHRAADKADAVGGSSSRGFSAKGYKRDRDLATKHKNSDQVTSIIRDSFKSWSGDSGKDIHQRINRNTAEPGKYLDAYKSLKKIDKE